MHKPPILAIASILCDTAITLNAKVLMNVLADSYVVLLGTAQVGENVEACHALIDKRINGFLDAHKKRAFRPKIAISTLCRKCQRLNMKWKKNCLAPPITKYPRASKLKKMCMLPITTINCSTEF